MCLHFSLGCWWKSGLAVIIALAVSHGTILGQEHPERQRVGLSVWDTRSSSSQQLTPEATEQKQGWKPIASGETTNSFEGDAVISNGVFNLCPDKPAVLAEVFRVLRPGGRLQMADILLHEDVTPEQVASKGEWSD